ncbi:MAG: hypothetical protein NTX71_05450 [Candidatus Aureabacteria bacterium]|nr:hypothetical protein [Candidatus Auribacterota bacterium]
MRRNSIEERKGAAAGAYSQPYSITLTLTLPSAGEFILSEAEGGQAPRQEGEGIRRKKKNGGMALRRPPAAIRPQPGEANIGQAWPAPLNAW